MTGTILPAEYGKPVHTGSCERKSGGVSSAFDMSEMKEGGGAA